MTEIFVEIRGGVLVQSYSNNSNVVVNLIDWDNINDNRQLASANNIPSLPLDCMPEETLAVAGRSLRNN